MAIARKPKDEESRLAYLDQLEVLNDLPEQALDDIALLAAEICAVPVAMVTFIDRDVQWIKGKSGIEVVQTPRSTAFCSHAILEQDMMEVTDATKDPRFFDNPHVTAEPRIQYYAGVPLVSEAGYGLGTLCVLDMKPRQLTAAQKACLEALARQVMLIIDSKFLTKQIARIDELKGELIAHVNHELRTPLSSVKSAIGYLYKNQSANSEKTRWFYDVAERNIRHVMELVDEMLDFQQISNNALEIVQDEIDVNEFVSDIIQLNHAYAESNQCRIQVCNELPGHTVCFDARRIGQVVTNLISNAVKYSHKGGMIRITVTGCESDFYVEVADDGVGIPKDFQPYIFGRFAQAKNAKRGSGLGLYICKNIVELHNGAIGFQSVEGKGARFFFTIPGALRKSNPEMLATA